MSSITTTHTPKFKGPRDTDWRPLYVVEEDDDSNGHVKDNQEKLHNSLLASLQMQHLMVLAGSGCSLSADGPAMSDLWNEVVGSEPKDSAKEAAEAVSYDISDTNIEAFLSRLESSLQLNDDETLRKFLNDSKKVILNKCSNFLHDGKLDSHITFLHRLSRRRVRDQRLKIFTTNYDLCFERAAGTLGGVALDGFSFSSPRRYDPRFFNYDIVRRPRVGDDSGNYLEGVFLLYKLHGSVNWVRKTDGEIYEETSPSPDEACLIYPASGKYQQSFTQPHLEFIAQYLAAVREPNTCVLIAGYGFNDDHLSEPLVAAAKSNPHLRLIISDKYAEEKLSNRNGANRFWDRFHQLSEEGEDVWFISADFQNLAQLIPDLKSLTPADTLMKAVQGIARGI